MESNLGSEATNQEAGNPLARIRRYSQNCVTPGFIPNRSLAFQMVMKAVTYPWCFAQLGRITVVGAENLRVPGRLVYVANHGSIFDAVVMHRVLPRYVHYMTLVDIMYGEYGLRPIVLGALGCFPTARPHGGAVVQPSIDLLVDSETIMMFPEAHISQDGSCLPLRPGCVRIARGAFDQLLQIDYTPMVAVVPIRIHYHRRDNASAVAPFRNTGLKWRGGVTVTVAAPIWMHESIGLSDEQIMASVRDHIDVSKHEDLQG